MKNIIASIILIACCYQYILAQLVYFNQVYQADSISMGSVSVKPVENGYLVVGDFNGSGGYSATYLRKINLFGETEWVKILDGAVQTSSIIFGNSMIRTGENQNIVVFTKGESAVNKDFALIQFDDTGTILQNHVYSSPDDLDGNAQIIATQDNGYLIAGWSSNQVTGTGSKYFMMKLDAGFNKIWSAVYGTWATIIHAEQTQDGGFVLSGYRYSNSTGYDMYVVKTDSTGTLQWQKNYGTNEDDGGCYVFQLSDGNLMLLGLIKSEIPDKKGLYVAKLSVSNGAIIGQAKTYFKNNSYSPQTYNYSPETDIVRVLTIGYNPPPKWEIAITAISEEGDILWETPISSGLAANKDYIRDIEPTPDGGYVLAGFNYASPASSWVLKTDSLGHGCSPAPCYGIEYPIGINPVSLTEPISPTQVYPNPAKGSTTITYSLPPQLPFGVLELYDLQGQKVRYQVLPAGGSPFTQTLDLSGLPSGMYVWRLAFPGGYERYEVDGKLVVD
ncbi:MAG: T9SS type A sorting domain-containing protein [Sphingobacteriales bacterium]|nr:MAG: T9SS type A sorting domain-containing protein [Sphingobacteriales bacterium]